MSAGGMRGSIGRGAVALCALLAALALAVAPAQAQRTLLGTGILKGSGSVPPPEGEIEGACGLAVSPGGDIYVSDYYHRLIDVFDSGGEYQSQIGIGEEPEGPCGLAIDSAGRLYANVFHQRVQRLLPTPQTFDVEDATGVAVDPETDYLYVNGRTSVSVYEPSGLLVLDEGQPLRIGLGSLGDSYGVAAFGGRVYVADAKDQRVKIYQPAVDPQNPVAVLKGTQTKPHRFVSLADASLAIDPSNGHFLLLDNLQPGYVHPEAAIYEFSATGVFLGQLPGAPVHGEPSGIAVAEDGTLYVTDGNDEGSNADEYSPYTESGPEALGPPTPGEPGLLGSQDGLPQSSATLGSAPTEAASAKPAGQPRGKPKARPAQTSRSQTQQVQKGPIRVAVSGTLAPTRLPREGVAPISVEIGGRITYTSPENPPQLQRVSFAFNRAGKFDRRGLPVCHLSDIDPSTTRQALEACRRSAVGEGRFSANVLLPEQSPFPSDGKVLAFNGVLKGKPVIFAHIYGTQPVPTSVVMALEVHQHKGTYGTVLDASLKGLTGDWGYVTGISLKLGREYSFHGERRSFLSAGCPAPKGFPGALFPLARTTFSFAGGRDLTATLTRSCTARG